MTRFTRSLLAAATTFTFSATALAADDTIRIGF